MDNKKLASELLKVAQQLVSKEEEFDMDVMPDAIADTAMDGIVKNLNKDLKAWGFDGFKFDSGVLRQGEKLELTIEDNKGKKFNYVVIVKKK